MIQKFEATETIQATGTTIWKPGLRLALAILTVVYVVEVIHIDEHVVLKAKSVCMSRGKLNHCRSKPINRSKSQFPYTKTCARLVDSKGPYDGETLTSATV